MHPDERKRHKALHKWKLLKVENFGDDFKFYLGCHDCEQQFARWVHGSQEIYIEARELR